MQSWGTIMRSAHWSCCGKIRQSPETVQRVLALDAVGVKVNEIATRLDVHHSTVRLILGTARAARDTQSPESRQTAALRA
jgi:transposase